MKNKGLLSLLLSIAILSGCKKDNHISDTTCGRTILGQWKLVKTTGGLCGCTTLPTSNDGLTFNADSSYSELSQGQTTGGRFSSQLVNGKY